MYMQHNNSVIITLMKQVRLMEQEYKIQNACFILLYYFCLKHVSL